MKALNLFKSLLLSGLTLILAGGGLTACDEAGTDDDLMSIPEMELSTTTLNFPLYPTEAQTFHIKMTGTGEWSVAPTNAAFADAVDINPKSGTKSANVSVKPGEASSPRQIELTVTLKGQVLGRDVITTQTVTVNQTADGDVIKTEPLYFDNFDGQTATQSFGTSGTSWPYLDQFPEFKNAVGTAAENVEYSGTGMSIRNNSNSDGNYSDVLNASGVNNLFFGANPSFVVSGLKLQPDEKNLRLQFASEKYLQSGDTVFQTSEFHIYVSKDGEKWAEIEDYTFHGTAGGRWNLAEAFFTLKEVPATLYLKFTADVASAYRMDDLALYVNVSGSEGQQIDLDNIVEKEPEQPEITIPEGAVYFDNFDGQPATQTFGSGSSWPFVDQFPEFKNAVGTAAENVEYSGTAISIRNNSNSNGSYSDVANASGVNNIFFGANAEFVVSGLKLNQDQNKLRLQFASEKYLSSGDSVFKTSEFHIYLSNDGKGWVEVKDYNFLGTASGRWNLAQADFTLKEVPATLYLKFTADVASAYRMDDLMLAVTTTGGPQIDLGDVQEPEQPEQPENPTPGAGKYISDSNFVYGEAGSGTSCTALDATTINGEAASGVKLGTSSKIGSYTSGAVGVTGDKYLSFYAVAWNNANGTVKVSVNGGGSIEGDDTFILNNGAGVAGNPPFTITGVTANDHYTVVLKGLTAASTITFETLNDAFRAVVAGVKITDEPVGDNDDPEQPEQPENPTPGDAGLTPENPLTVAQAIAKAEETGQTATAEVYYIKGFVASITEQFGAQFGNATFTMSDSKDAATGNFMAYRIYYLNNQKWVEGNDTLNKGDEVIVCGKIVNYYGNTPETAQNSGYLYQIVNKNTEQPEQPVPPTPGEGSKTDVLNQTWTGVTNTTYTDFGTKKGSASEAVYAGMCAGDKGSIQLRSATDKNYSGVVTTVSGGKVTIITVKWVGDTAAARVLDIYGKNEPYTSAQDLYGNNAGTVIASFAKSEGDKTIAIPGDYKYIGFRSNSGALYLDEVQITWE